MKVSSTSQVNQEEFHPIQVVEVELNSPLPTLRKTESKVGGKYGSAMILVRMATLPIGSVEVAFQDEEISPEQLAESIWRHLSNKINQCLIDSGQPKIDNLDPAGIGDQSSYRNQDSDLFISVIVCTHERADSLEISLDSLCQLLYPNYEVVIVDNASKTNATKELYERKYAALSNFKYVQEPNKGLSWARNRGAISASGDIIAYTDDDVIVDKYWLSGLVNGFNYADDVDCVNGLVFPGELETIEQTWFEQAGSFNKGYERRIYDLKEHRPKRPFYPYSAGLFGTGANMAIRRSTLERVGYFDPALGPGTWAGGADDLSMYVEILLHGGRLVYEPSALVYHYHRRQYENLKKQMHNYGSAFTSLLLKTMIKHPKTILELVIKSPYGLYLAISPNSIKNEKIQDDYPPELKRIEWNGLISGLYLYWRSVWTVRQQKNNPVMR